MGQQHRLEFGRGDLVALVLDELLAPSGDRDVATRVTAAEVTRVQPTLVVNEGHGAVPTPAGTPVRPAGREPRFRRNPGVEAGVEAGVGIDDPGLRPRQRQAD